MYFTRITVIWYIGDDKRERRRLIFTFVVSILFVLLFHNRSLYHALSISIKYNGKIWRKTTRTNCNVENNSCYSRGFCFNNRE